MNFTLNNLREIQEEFHSFFGDKFIGAQLAQKTIGLKREKVDLINARAHPLSKWLITFDEEIKVSLSKGLFQLSDNSLYLLDLYYSLIRIKPLMNSGRIIERLKQKDHFFSTVYEARVARTYLDKGYEIVIGDETGSKEKCPDFFIPSNEGRIYIEAKSLEDYVSSESQHWNTLSIRLNKKLTRSHKSWKVSITAFKNINGNDCNELVTFISGLIDRGTTGSFITGSKDFKIDVSGLLPWDEVRSMPFQDNSTAEQLYMEATVWCDDSGMSWYKNPHIIEVFPLMISDRAKSIIRNIKKAQEQIPASSPSFIHIELPYKKGENLQLVVDNCFEKVFSFLNKQSVRVNGLFLSGIETNTSPLEGEDIVLHPYFYIPSMSPKYQLPSSFSMSLSNQIEIPNIGIEGRIEFFIQPYTEFKNQKGRIIFHGFSHDGRVQIRIWQTYTGVVRADLLSPNIRRQYIEFDWDLKIDTTKESPVVISWSPLEMCVYINGEIAARNRLKN